MYIQLIHIERLH